MLAVVLRIGGVGFRDHHPYVVDPPGHAREARTAAFLRLEEVFARPGARKREPMHRLMLVVSLLAAGGAVAGAHGRL